MERILSQEELSEILTELYAAKIIQGAYIKALLGVFTAYVENITPELSKTIEEQINKAFEKEKDNDNLNSQLTKFFVKDAIDELLKYSGITIQKK